MEEKSAQEKVTEAIQSAKAKIEKIAEDERVQAAKAKLNELSENEQVQEVKKQALGCIGSTRAWIVTNWQSGRNGKLKVVAAFVVVFLVLKGVLGFFGGVNSTSGGESKTTIIYADSEDRDVLPSTPVRKQVNVWMCGYCGAKMRQNTSPACIRCPARPPTRSSPQGNHSWQLVGREAE